MAAVFAFCKFLPDGLTRCILDRAEASVVETNATDFTYQKGFRVRDAIGAGDFATADQITADVLAHSQIQNWRNYPFDDFVPAVLSAADPAFERRLTEWTAKSPMDAIPRVLRAQYYYDTGWVTRGHDFAPKIAPARMAAFVGFMAKARADIDAAIRLDDRDPYEFYLKLRILQGNGLSREFIGAFAEARDKYPDYYPLYEVMLGTLAPSERGDIPAMYRFVDQYAGAASQFSPLKLLYLNLYRDFLSSASFGCAARIADPDQLTECVVSFMQKAATPDLERHVLTALRLYDHTDKHQFDIAVRKIVADMLQMKGGDTYSGALLQLAATAMHSDTQLKEERPEGRNDYVIDELVAQSWGLKGFPDNELTKYKEALGDARLATFPSDEERNVAIAFIYEQLAAMASNQRQYDDEIAFEQEAVALGVTWDAHHICYGYYELKRYADAVKACTDAINSTGNPNARYWRGTTYRVTGKLDEAIQDLTKVADSEGNFASSAAIDLSMIYFSRNDRQGALDVLNKYTFLYDTDRTAKSDVAVGYNNRCYAYMQLGELQKALDDCTQSLRYGSIPDAFRKQQELVKRLSAQPSATPR